MPTTDVLAAQLFGPAPPGVCGAFHCKDGTDREASMAKGQKRSNRETRKPKTDKQPTPVAATSLLTKGILTPFAARPPRKK